MTKSRDRRGETMGNGGIEWQTMKVAMATAEGGDREREDERLRERN